MSPTEALALSKQAEQLGIIGILAVFLLLAMWAAWYFRKEAAASHERRERELSELRASCAQELGDLRTKCAHEISELERKLQRCRLAFISLNQQAEAKGVKFDSSQLQGLDVLLGTATPP